MSVDFWRNAELFYEFWFVILSVLAFLSMIVIIFSVTYAEKRNRKKLIIGVLSFYTVLGLIGFFGHNRYEVYLDQATHVNPLIRDRQPRFASYIHYGASEQSYYTQFNNLDSLRDMDLYEEEQVTEPIVYLGQGDRYHYFERLDGQSFKHHREIEFIESAEGIELIGSRFTLKDEAFKEIGFKNPGNTMYDRIQMPLSEEGKTYEPKDDAQIPRAEDTINRWNF